MNALNTTSFQIEGMTCASCVGRVEKVLSAVEGVTKASVNLATETAQIVHDDSVGAATLSETLSQAGYPAIVEAQLYLYQTTENHERCCQAAKQLAKLTTCDPDARLMYAQESISASGAGTHRPPRLTSQSPVRVQAGDPVF